MIMVVDCAACFCLPQVGEFGGDNRAGIDATLHRISCMRNRSGRIVGLTCRVGRAIKGSAELVKDLVLSGASILFLGRPGGLWDNMHCPMWVLVGFSVVSLGHLWGRDGLNDVFFLLCLVNGWLPCRLLVDHCQHIKLCSA